MFDVDLSGMSIAGEYLEKIIHFLFAISDRVDLVSSSYCEMTKDEYESAMREGKYFHKEMYQRNGMSDEEFDEMNNGMVEEYLDYSGMTEEEIWEVKERNQRLSDYEIKEAQNRENSFIQAESINRIIEEKFPGLLCSNRIVTCKTHCTLGGATVVYSFFINDTLKQRFLQMELLTWPFKSKDREFIADDPAFYSKGELLCSVCSHEGYITMKLNEEQYELFKSLDIPFQLRNRQQEDKINEFPYLKETLRVLSMGSAVTTLLGRGLFIYEAYEGDIFQKYLKFFQWFDENEDRLRNEIKPCKKSVREILAYLQQKYTLEPYQSIIIERQCQRCGWDSFYTKPSLAQSQQITPELKTFLYRLDYKGEELVIGGEYNSEYIFVDTLNIEERFKSRLEQLNKGVYAITEQGDVPNSLLQLMREINIYRGIDEYEKYDSVFFRTYIQTLQYEEFMGSDS